MFRKVTEKNHPVANVGQKNTLFGEYVVKAVCLLVFFLALVSIVLAHLV